MTKWYGNLTNRLAEGGEITQPQVGMGVTQYMYSDRHAYTIVEVAPSGKRFWMTRDSYSYDEGGYGKDYKSNPDSKARYEVRKYRGKWKMLRAEYVTIGVRDAYYDPHF